MVLWWTGGDGDRLRPSAREIIEDPENEKFVSAVSMWEIALKARIGKLDGDVAEIAAALSADGFPIIGIATVHLVRLRGLPLFDDHKDPFDQLLIATALSEGLVVMSSDSSFARYGLTVVNPAA